MSPQSTTAQIEAAARAIREADALLMGAGAGMGVDSGLPDFRGAEGFWKAYPPPAGAAVCRAFDPALVSDRSGAADGCPELRRG